MAFVEIKYNDSKKIKKQSSQNSFSTLKCMYLNATSLDNKLDEFKTVVDTYRPKIIGISETWFKNYSVVNVPGYNIYRRDRSDGRRGGGVCI